MAAGDLAARALAMKHALSKILQSCAAVREADALLFTCPVCGYLTLHEHAAYEVCAICSWEDDGLDGVSGPNHGIDLKKAQVNFERYLSIFGEDFDHPLTPVELSLQRMKRAVLDQFSAFAGFAISDQERCSLYATITQQLRSIRKARHKEFQRTKNL